MSKIILSGSGSVRSFESLITLHKAPKVAKAARAIEKDANGFPVESAASALFTMVSGGPTMEADFIAATGFTSRADEAMESALASTETLLSALAAESVEVGDNLSTWKDGLEAETVERVEKRVNAMANEKRLSIMAEGHKAFRAAVTAIRKAAMTDESKRLAVARGGFASTVFIRAGDLSKVPAEMQRLFVIDGSKADK